MIIADGTETLGDALTIASSLVALTTWASDPAVMTAIASLLTAAAAFWRSRARRAKEEPAPLPSPTLAEAYSTLHDAEEKIREELLQQLQHLQEEAERIGQDLSFYRQATINLEEAIIRCPDGSCPVREQLEAP